MLITVGYRGRRIGVLRDREGRSWLSSAIHQGAGARLDGWQPARQALPGGASVVGGLLPPGAVTAEVIDDAGRRQSTAVANGAYVAVVDQSIRGGSIVVCCRDEHGAPVARPLPASWLRTPVSDACEPCPACEAVGWDEVWPTDGSRGERTAPDGGMESTPIVVCRTCGHEERMGRRIVFRPRPPGCSGGTSSTPPLDAPPRDLQRSLLREVQFPIYGADGFSASIAGHSRRSSVHGDRDAVTSIRVAQPTKATPRGRRLEITTELASDDSSSDHAVARAALNEWLRSMLPPPNIQRSEAGRTIAWRAVDRERRKLATKAEARLQSLMLSDQPAPFTLLVIGERWIAVGGSGGLRITVSATSLDPNALSLRPINKELEKHLNRD